MNKNIQIVQILSVLLFPFLFSACIKSEDPCHGAKHVKADFYMEEICPSNNCADFWQNYKTNFCSSGWIRFTSTNDSTIDFEWHIGSGVYHGYKLDLNFSNAVNGTIIPIMLIVKQSPNPTCIPNDNGTDTIIRNLKIDYNTHLCYGTWKGIYTDVPSDTSTILIAKDYNIAASDSISYIKYLYPSTIDTLMGYSRGRSDFRQEISVVLGSTSFSAYGNALTDSAGQTITIYYGYTSLSNTTTIYKTFKGKRI